MRKIKTMLERQLYSVIILTLLSVSCSHHASTQSLRTLQRSGDVARTQSLDQFWKSFRAALKTNDISEILRMTKFPLDVDLAGIEGFEGIEHREGFERHYGTLFPKPAIRTLLNEAPQPGNADGDSNRNGVESWSVCHSQPNEISELEWSIIYCFERNPNGEIKLTAIHFAG